MNTLDPNKVVPLLRRKLTQMHDVVYITESTFGTGVDLDLWAYRRRRNQRRKQRRQQRRQQRRFQMLRDQTHVALGRLVTRNWSYVAAFSRERETGAIAARQMWRSIGKLFVVRARLGR